MGKLGKMKRDIKKLIKEDTTNLVSCTSFYNLKNKLRFHYKFSRSIHKIIKKVREDSS